MLHDYLRIVPYILPQDKEMSLRPRMRHPDLQPNNVIVSENLEITGLIDWQHCAILPLFLRGGIPASLQNYGDEVSESLGFPSLPDDFDDLSEDSLLKQVELLWKRQLHYYCIAKTADIGSVHANALKDPLFSMRRKIFSHASDPWEGDNVTLKADLIDVTKVWSRLAQPSSGDSIPTCPVEFSEAEKRDCLQRAATIQEADAQFRTCMDLVGVGNEAWVPVELHDGAKLRSQQLLEDTLGHAESDEEKRQIQEHWIFSDFDEDEYF